MTHPTPTSPQESAVEELRKALSDAQAFVQDIKIGPMMHRGDHTGRTSQHVDGQLDALIDQLGRTFALLDGLTRTSEEPEPGCPTFDEIVAAFGKSDRGYPHTYQGIVDLVRSRWPKRTRPSVDEEFVRAAKTLRAEYAATDEYVEHSPTHKILAAFDAALASVEGKPAQPTAVDERIRNLETLVEVHAKLLALVHPLHGKSWKGLVDRLTALERAQASETECNACHGTGTHGALNGSAPCWLCHGRGKVKTLVSLHGTMPPPAPAVKGEAVAGWMPTTDEMLDAANGCYGNTRDEMESVRRLISQRVPRVDVRQLMRDYLGEWAPDKISDHHVEAMSAALAKQSITTADSAADEKEGASG